LLIKAGWLDNTDVCGILINQGGIKSKKVTKILLRCMGAMVFMGYMG
jgi:hypothetical protein